MILQPQCASHLSAFIYFLVLHFLFRWQFLLFWCNEEQHHHTLWWSLVILQCMWQLLDLQVAITNLVVSIDRSSIGRQMFYRSLDVLLTKTSVLYFLHASLPSSPVCGFCFYHHPYFLMAQLKRFMRSLFKCINMFYVKQSEANLCGWAKRDA